ncbi:hypothetical protein SteCoe_4594 [Stentor coeruleus]|uniref:Uncharacterized protein n=1 Tax=Stentor coeruleus TaxID=5963 RepID=A0A1R2CUC7_9CILI|nr:hypothetical protein SteCoe_4594 [Stentor coeruleus]
MDVKLAIEKTLSAPDKKVTSSDNFQLFVKDIVKSEVRIVFKSLSEDGVQAGKKDIDKSRRKITKKVIQGDKGRHRMDTASIDKIKAYVKSYLIQKFVHR